MNTTPIISTSTYYIVTDTNSSICGRVVQFVCDMPGRLDMIFVRDVLSPERTHGLYLDQLVLTPAPIDKLVVETAIVDSTRGIKNDNGKTQWWYLPIEPIRQVLAVLAYGDKKYPSEDGCNWKKVPNAKKRYYDALMRHMTAYYEGEKNDQESGLSHLAHAASNALFLLWFEIKGE